MTGAASGDVRRDSPAAIAALLLSSVLYFATSAVSFPLLPRLVSDVVGGQETETGLAFAGFGLGLLVVRPFVAGWADRWGRRPLIAVGAVVASVSQLLVVPAAELGLWPLVGVRFLSGLAGSGMYVALATVATELPTPTRRASVFAIFSASTFVGFAIGPLVGDLVFEAAGFSAAYSVAAGLALFPAIGVLFFRETKPATPAERLAGVARLLHPIGARLGVAAMSSVIVFMSFNAFVTDWAMELGSDSARWVLTTFAVAALLYRVGARRFLDGNRVAVATAAYGALIVGSLIQASAGSIIWLYPAAAILALGMAYLGPLLILIGADSAPDSERARIVATVVFFNDIGSSLALPILGWIAEEIGFRPMYLVIAGLAVVSLGYFRSPVLSDLDGLRPARS